MIIFRIVAFALFPAVLATIEILLSRKPLDRETLRPPFYAQCFLAGPFVLVLSLAGTAVQIPNPALAAVATLAALGSTLLFIAAESRWFVHSTGAGNLRAFSGAFGGYVICMALLALLAILMS